MGQSISRRNFLKGVAAGAVSLGAMSLTGCAASGTETTAGTTEALETKVQEAIVSSKNVFAAGTYTSTQKTDFATVNIICDIAADGLKGVAYEVVETSDSDYFAIKSADVTDYCNRVAEAGSTVGVDGISGATLCTSAVKKGVNECLAQALGIDLTVAAASASAINPQYTDYDTNSVGDLSKSALFSEWKLGNMTFSHRMVKSAAFQLAFMKCNRDEYVNYYKRMAEGGVEMIWIEDFANFWEMTASPLKQAPEMYDVVGMVEELHAAGAKLGCQFDTMGAAIGPLTFSTPFLGDYTTEDVKSWEQAIIGMGKKLKDYGFDAYELNFAANNVGQSFLSRARNNRTDEYDGSSLENRTRFAVECIKGIKEACGQDFVVQVLINAVEENDTSLGNSSDYCTIEETIAIAKILEAAGADSLHLRIGPQGEHVAQFAGDLYFTARGLEGYNGYGQRFDFDKHFQGLVRGNHSGVGLNLDIAAKVKAEVSIPVGCATYNDPAIAPDIFVSAIEEGKVDFLVMNRPLCVDPQYVNKLRENRLDEIAPCTRCLHCFYDTPRDNCHLEHCRVNAANFRAYGESMPEGYDPAPAETAKNVMVIGGGPAGLEAARIAAERGHSVTVYDKNASMGGMLPFAEAVKGSHEHLGRLANYLVKQCELQGVTLVNNTEVTADFIAEKNPDAVILAVGGKRESTGLTSTSATNVISVDDLLGGSAGDNVVIVGGNMQAVDAALYLMDQGKTVNIVSPYAKADFEKGHSVNVQEFVKPAIFAAGLKLYPNATVTQVGEGEIVFTSEAGVEMKLPCDTVVEALDMVPNTDLMNGLSVEAIAVGDCIDPYNIASAIATGNLAGRKI